MFLNVKAGGNHSDVIIRNYVRLLKEDKKY